LASACADPGGELAYQQERGPNVLVEEGVDLGGGEIGKPSVAAASVVDDQDVERAERPGGRRHDMLGRRGVGEICFEERHRKLAGDHLDATRLGAPTLVCIVRGPAVDEDGRSGLV
jgi:hypothetical protein